MRLFQTMIFTDRSREGVRLALTTLASGESWKFTRAVSAPKQWFPSFWFTSHKATWIEHDGLVKLSSVK